MGIYKLLIKKYDNDMRALGEEYEANDLSSDELRDLLNRGRRLRSNFKKQIKVTLK